jgi:hypothetical protein
MAHALSLLRAELAPNACDLFGLALSALVVAILFWGMR